MQFAQFAWDDDFTRAVSAQRDGNLPSAESLCRAVVARRPVDFDALHLLASLLSQTGRADAAIDYYQRALLVRPRHPAVLAGLATALKQTGDFETALTTFELAASLEPENPDILFNYGNALAADGQSDQAADIYRQALELRPNDPDCLNNLAQMEIKRGKFWTAADLCNRATVLAPDRIDIAGNLLDILCDLGLADAVVATCDLMAHMPGLSDAAWSVAGAALLRVNRNEEAIKAFEQAVAADDKDASLLLQQGRALSASGRHEQALKSFQKALLIDKHNPEGFNLLAAALQNLNRHKEAIEACGFALLNKPDYAEAHNRQAHSHLTLEQWREAVAASRKALALDPDFQEAIFNLGMGMIGVRQFEQAVDCFKKLLAAGPNDNMALLNLGNSLLGAGRAEEAQGVFIATVEKMPQWCGAYLNLGHCHMHLGQFETSIECYQKGLAMEPENPQFKYSIGNVRLHMGDYVEGFAGYEHRWKTPNGLDQLLPDVPLWRNQDLTGKSILVYGEQGLGDNIQMARYLAPLCWRGAKVTFKGYGILKGLLGTADSGIEFLEEVGEAKFDYQIPIMSLPFAMGSTVDSLPNPPPFLFPKPELAERWRKRIGRRGFKIGVIWQGNPNGMIDFGRSTPLKKLLPIARLPGVRLISLQKNFGLDQLQNLPSGMEVETLGDDFDSGPEAFVDSAGVIANLDLVVTTDTSMAHVAGALGAPTFLALKKLPDWRWLLDRSDSPWYPSMTLFRQTENNVWDDVFERMAETLRPKLRKR